jgi:hypothetical protein
MASAHELTREAMRVLAVGGWRANEIVVGDMDYFCQKLDLRKMVSKTNDLSELYGLRVRERKWMPRGRASVIDETEKVIRIFEL